MRFAATTPPHMATLVFLTMLSTITLNMFLPSLSNMAAEFDVPYALVALSVSGYLVSTAAVMLIMGPLSDRLGRRPVLIGGLAVYVAASFVCTLATDFWVFLTFRVLQGAMVAGWTLSLAVVRDTVPANQAASRIGYITMAMAIGPMLGPTFGGFLDAAFGWRASFVAYTALGIAALIIVWLDLGETNKTPSKTFGEQFRAYPELIRSRRFWGFAVCAAGSVGAFYSFLAGAPLVAQKMLGVAAAELGIYIGIITAGFTFGSFLSGRFAARTELTTMVLSGRLVACGGLALGLICIMFGMVNVVTVFGAAICVGIGNGLTMPSCNAGIMSVRPRLAGSAAGASGALALGIGSLLTALTGIAVGDGQSAIPLLAVMLASSFVGLLGVLVVMRIDRREGAFPARTDPTAPTAPEQ